MDMHVIKNLNISRVSSVDERCYMYDSSGELKYD